MPRPFRGITLALLALLAAACSHGKVGREFVFTPDKGYALIAYDIYFIAETWPNYALYLFPFDEETGAINPGKRVESGSGFISFRKNQGVKFYLGTSDPGSYVVGFLFFQSEGQRSILCFADKTLKVDIEPGKVHYLGEMTFTLDHPPGLTMMELDLIAHDKAHVRGRMAKYRNIQAPIVIAPHTFVSFERGEDTEEGACINGYLD